MSVKFNGKHLARFVKESEFAAIYPQVEAAHNLLESRTGPGNDFLGWVDLPVNYDKEEFARIKQAAAKIMSDTDVLLVIGIGGSYLGARAAIEAMAGSLYNATRTNTPEIYFVGNSISSSYLNQVLKICEGKRVSLNIISKSGTTTEPAVAFRVVKEYIEKTYGKQEASARIVAITDAVKGALKTLATQEGYRTFVVPDNVGGRYSVLTPVGILPIVVAGFDIRAMLKGAAAEREALLVKSADNEAVKYAAMRNLLYSELGKKVEILVTFNPKLQYLGEWWKQLYGESEGKDLKGIFPASIVCTTDLHSMGQFIQEGDRVMFETTVTVAKSNREVVIGSDEQNLDQLNYLAGQRVEHCNAMAQLGTKLAHIDGGVPQMEVGIERINEENLGALFYFFEFACGISAYVLGINPFNQPGVEAYKKNMFALLRKPGYEAQTEAILKRI